MLQDTKLNKTTPIPLYYQLKELILTEIKSGAYKYESMIPTEIELSEIFQISRTTVRQAILELVREGWLYRIKSKGTFVAMQRFSQKYVQTLESFNNQILHVGKIPSTELLEFKVIVPNEVVANALKLQTNDNVIYIHRKRFADDDPILMVETYLPFKMCNYVAKHDLEKESLYSILATNDETHIKKIQRLTTAEDASCYYAENLKIHMGKAILRVLTIGFNMFGDPVEYSLSRENCYTSNYEVFNNKF